MLNPIIWLASFFGNSMQMIYGSQSLVLIFNNHIRGRFYIQSTAYIQVLYTDIVINTQTTNTDRKKPVFKTSNCDKYTNKTRFPTCKEVFNNRTMLTIFFLNIFFVIIFDSIRMYHLDSSLFIVIRL